MSIFSVRRCAAALAATVAIATVGVAFASAPPDQATVNALLRGSSRQATIAMVSEFSGPHGLLGVVYKDSASGHTGVVWLTPDGQAVIPGAVYDAQGHNLTQAAERRLGIKLTPAKLVAAGKAPAAHAIEVGTTGPVLTAYIDPNCPFCNELYRALKTPVAQGKLRVRYVMVGLIRPNSAARSAAILTAKNPAAALAQNEAGFDAKDEQGGYTIPADRSAYAPMLGAVAANGATMGKGGGDGTPTLAYCDSATHEYVTREGFIGSAALLAGVAPAATCGH